jgi:hypothetical protein
MDIKAKVKSRYFRILVILAIVIVYLVYDYYPCILLSSVSLPGKIKTKDVIIIYGGKICKSCPTGKYLYSLRERGDFLVIVPSNYNKYDIANLKDVFEIKGRIINGDEEVIKLVEKINDCNGISMDNANYYLKLGENGKINSIAVLKKAKVKDNG